MSVATMNSGQDLNIPLVPWKAGDVLAALLTAVIGMLAIIVIFALIIDDVDSESPLTINVSVAAVSAILLLVSWFFGPMKYRVSITTLGLRSLRSLGASHWLLPLMALTIILIFNGIYGIATSELDWDVLELPDLPFKDFGASSLLIAGFLVIAVVPFTEEAFFRGFVLAGLARGWGPVAGILASSVFFSVAHGSVAVLIPIFVAGLLLAWLYLRTGSLLASVLVHSAQNAIAFAVGVGT